MLSFLLSSLLPSLLLLSSQSLAHSDGAHHNPHDHHGFIARPPSSAAAAANESLLWGSYRPNLYFGMRPRVAEPETFLFGLAWMNALTHGAFGDTRHACQQEDQLKSYGWIEHDGRTSGKHVLKDELNNMILTTEFLKIPGGKNGGSWSARIRTEPLDPSQHVRVSFFPYFAVGSEGELELSNEEEERGIPGSIELSGSTPALGKFQVRMEEDANNPPVSRSSRHDDLYGDQSSRFQYRGLSVPDDMLYRAKDLILEDVYATAGEIYSKYEEEDMPEPAIMLALSNDVPYGSNLFAFQKVLEGKAGFDVHFESGQTKRALDGESLTAGLASASTSFRDRFTSTFSLPSRGFSPAQVDFAAAITSNLLGGIGYFYGSGIVDRSFAFDYDDIGEIESGKTRTPAPEYTEKRELFTATPSRSFFPRGFYWDEGFHLLLIGEWDNDLSLEILRSWVSLIDENGWVGREQILGPEARSKVPPEFQPQIPSYANPPTLAMAVTAYISRLRARGISSGELKVPVGNDPVPDLTLPPTSDPVALSTRHLDEPQLAQSFLVSIYPHLRRHYNWFRRSQKGQIAEWDRTATAKGEGYRWRGRTRDHVLTSGLDDYPRATPPHAGELHLDLMSWVAFFSNTMREIAAFIGEEDDTAEYEENYQNVVANIEDLHWNEEKEMYCDLSVDADGESYHACFAGYVTLFPFLLQLLPADSPHLGPILDLLRDPERLWTSYGIRSLSATEPLFGQGENYWRGPIWIHMNYLALQALNNKYAKDSGPNQTKAAQIYAELRDNIIKNVFKEYERTGYVWEQYDASTGEGRRSHPFTGWTSLVTLIMAEKY